ncbi:MAG: hypothetical protein ACUVWX_13320 [Kiritimatiellia bacterium]
MSAELPDTVTVVHERFDSVRYILPRRTLGPLRWWGLPVILAGVVLTAFMVFWMSSLIRAGLTASDSVRWGAVLVGLLGLPPLLTGLVLVLAGVAICLDATHTEVCLTPDRLSVLEKCGPFRWRSSCKLGDIRRFLLRRGVEIPHFDPTHFLHVIADAAVLVAESEAERRVYIAPAYPLHILRPLARVLAEAAGSAKAEYSPAGRQAPATISALHEEDAADPVPKPTSSDIRFEKTASGVAISVPPAGLLRGSHGLFLGSLVVSVMIVILFFLFVFAGPSLRERNAFWGLLVVLFVLFLIEGALLIVALNMGSRRTLLAVSRDRLGYRRTSLFGATERQIPLAQIESICFGPTGVVINNRPMLELQIHLKGGQRKIGILSERTTAELEWLADELRRAIAAAGTFNPPDQTEQGRSEPVA